MLEVREAVDFLRFYASEARRQFTGRCRCPGRPASMNELRLHGRGVFACIRPWNFPLAIFTGLVAAPLAAGNAVIAKPAGQTPLIGALAIELMHQAGIPKDIVQLAPGDGRVVGGTLTAHPLLAGVVFTGSTDTARMINRTPRRPRRADHPVHRRNRRPECDDRRQLGPARAGDPRRHFLQLSRARASAARRCACCSSRTTSPIPMIEMIAGAMQALTVGDPRDIRTDVGPVIDKEAKAALDDAYR